MAVRQGRALRVFENDVGELGLACSWVKPTAPPLLISGWHNSRVFNHEHYRSLRRSCPVKHSLGHHETLSRRELNCSPLQVNQQLAFDDVKELVIVIVLVPVVFALNDA